MSYREIDRLHVIRNVLDKKLSWSQAAEQLRLSNRQVGRLCARVRSEGARGVIHGLRGHPSNRQLDPEMLEKALSVLHDPLWEGFGPTFARQKLQTLYGLTLGEWTVRKLMIQTEIWKPQRRMAKHRAWRERRRCVGILVQLDGSPHDWFEGRGPKCVLLIYIDDATSRILYGEFVKVEATLIQMRATKSYLEHCGRPVAFYIDKGSVYKVNRPASLEEQLRGEQSITQFTRAMKQLGIEMIFAHSPQAKGRVERGFSTHQDRLIKEMRLRGISSIEEGNAYLWKEYIPEHNASYAVEPAHPTDAHKPLLASHDLDAILAIQEPRSINSDFTIQWDKRFFQLDEKQPVRLRPKDRITVLECLDGRIRFAYKGHYLNARPLKQRPYRPLAHPQIRSVRSPQPMPFYGTPRAAGGPSNAFQHLRFDPVLAFRKKAERDAFREAP